jgi:lipid II:glycine glycyltransferase (peptidoglycan interpeptide bridge formation enzyme)
VPSGARLTIDVNPAQTLITDLTKSEEELLAGMHEKTRYNIRVAQRHGVDVDLDHRSFEEVWPLFSETSSRGAFRLHEKHYYETMLASLRGGDVTVFCPTCPTKPWRSGIGHKTSLPLAATIMVDFGYTRTYLHGASSSQHREFMAPTLLHWRLMLDAKARGLRWYDWWGVAPRGAPASHPWAGISRFKRGFGGEEVSSPGTYDIVTRPARYFLYTLSRQLVRSLRRL